MKVWLYGKVMSGKTTFASQFENAKIISTDGNAEYTFDEKDIFRVRNYKELNDAIADLKSIKPKWVIVDTTSYLIDYLRFYWCDKNKVEHESEIAYKGYTMLRSFLWESIFSIANSFDNVMFISHEQEVIEKNKFGREISKFQPVFEEKLRDQMSGLMGIIARTVKTISEDGTAKYELHISNSDDEFGGSRLKIKETAIPLDKKSFDENFVVAPKKFDAEKIITGELKVEETYAEKDEKVETPKRKSVIG
ncbi:MAG: ATP-binding protein [Anaeroplasmataceae bacterium]|nr:ATP-binding protein [Anaeroplasmataceae bacterium]